MTNIIESLKSEIEIFDFFSEVYVFGSILFTDIPNDVDLLLVYEKEKNDLEYEKGKIYYFFASAIGIDCHFVTLSKNEVKQTKFLDYVLYKKIK